MTDLAGASATQMASHRRATMTDGEIDGVVQLPLLPPLHIQHTPLNLVALIFHSATFNLQIKPISEDPLACWFSFEQYPAFHRVGYLNCNSSVTHKTHVCSITKIDWLMLVAKILPDFS